MISTIFVQETMDEAQANRDKVADTLRDKHEKLGSIVGGDWENLVAHLDYPSEHWA